MRASITWALLALAVGGCNLLFNPEDHLGGGTDGGVRDSGGFDVPLDVPMGTVDGGEDAGPPPPPECTTASDCGIGGTAGIVQCVAQRCVFCADPSEATAHTLRSETNLRPYLSMGVRRRAVGPALVLVGTLGSVSTVPTLVHRAEIDAPSGATDQPVAAALLSTGCGPFETVTSLDFFTPEGESWAEIAVLSQNAMRGTLARLGWSDTSPLRGDEGCGTLAAPADYFPSAVLVEAESSAGDTGTFQVTRESRADGSMVLGSNDFTFRGNRAPSSSLPTSSFARLSSAGPFAVIRGESADVVAWWNPAGTASISVTDTPGRTGDPSAVPLGPTVAAGMLMHFWMAYPVGDRVRLVNVDCEAYCNGVGESVDVRTSAMAVEAVRLGIIDDVPVVLTSERLADGTSRIALRVLRANFAPYDAPGGGRELIVATFPAGATITDIQLSAVAGTTDRYALAWMVDDGTGTMTAQLRTFTGTCTP